MKRVEENQRKDHLDLLGATVDVKLILADYPQSKEIQDCLNRKQFFGLGNGQGGIIVFDVDELMVFDLVVYGEGGKMVKTKSKDFKQFLDYIKLSLITHRMFIPGQVCVSYFKKKKLIKQ